MSAGSIKMMYAYTSETAFGVCHFLLHLNGCISLGLQTRIRYAITRQADAQSVMRKHTYNWTELLNSC